MSDFINTRPQSLYYTQDNIIPKKAPSNLSVRGCTIDDHFDNYDRKPFKESQEPHPRTGAYWLNPQTYNPAPGFLPVNCKRSGFPTPTYVSDDPRLLNSATADIITLDRPPTETSVRLKNVYDEKLRNYGKGYRDYSDIGSGQITYYIDKSLEDAFFTPLFEISSHVQGQVYKDPMGAMKPQYYRKPLVSSNPLKNNMRNFSCLTSINDSTSFRENIMGGTDRAGGLMTKMNEQKYQSRWTNNSD